MALVFQDTILHDLFLRGLITGISFLCGVAFLRSNGAVPKWEEQSVPETVRVKWSRLQGWIFMLNAAICPLGLLVWYFLRFDQDFILIAQVIGLVAISLLGLVPLKQKR